MGKNAGQPQCISMTDLLRVLPHFSAGQYANLISVLERHQLTTADLLTLDAADIGKRTQLPLLDVKKLCSAVLDALHSDLDISVTPEPASAAKSNEGDPPDEDTASGPKLPLGRQLRHTADKLSSQWSTISTLDPALDRALGGGIPTGYITEITGESGAGKTQFLLTLLLAVQLPPPHGLGRPALYISTEASLSTRRLAQLLAAHPVLRSAPTKPSLDNILSTTTADLESQDHILTFQVPVEVARRNAGLIVLDSVAANYRAEFERGAASASGLNMAARSAELVRLGMLLRELARTHDLAVVVANQVADRFTDPGPAAATPHGRVLDAAPRTATTTAAKTAPDPSAAQESPLASRTRAPNPAAPAPPPIEPPSSIRDLVPRSSASAPPPSSSAQGSDSFAAMLTLDHQQRWFTGWGDDPSAHHALKTPSLGLVWASQLACRIALFRRPVLGGSRGLKRRYPDDGSGDEGAAAGGDEPGRHAVQTWRRWMKVVFAPHAPPSGPGTAGAVEFEITPGGIRARTREGSKKK